MPQGANRFEERLSEWPSTLNGQSTDNQRLELERMTKRHGWQIAEVFDDPGISGARRREHPAAAIMVPM